MAVASAAIARLESMVCVFMVRLPFATRRVAYPTSWSGGHTSTVPPISQRTRVVVGCLVIPPVVPPDPVLLPPRSPGWLSAEGGAVRPLVPVGFDCPLTVSIPLSICFPVFAALKRSRVALSQLWLDFFCAQASGPRNPIARKVRNPMIKMSIGSLHVCASAANTTIVSRNAQSVLRTIKKKYVLREQYITCLRRATSFKIFRRADLLPDRAHRQRTTCSTNRCSTWRN